MRLNRSSLRRLIESVILEQASGESISLDGVDDLRFCLGVYVKFYDIINNIDYKDIKKNNPGIDREKLIDIQKRLDKTKLAQNKTDYEYKLISAINNNQVTLENLTPEEQSFLDYTQELFSIMKRDPYFAGEDITVEALVQVGEKSAKEGESLSSYGFVDPGDPAEDPDKVY